MSKLRAHVTAGRGVLHPLTSPHPLIRCAASNRRHSTARLYWQHASSPPDTLLPLPSRVLLQPHRSMQLPALCGFARNPLWSAHAMRWLEPEACAALVAAAEAHAASCGGWSACRHHDTFPTMDFEVS